MNYSYQLNDHMVDGSERGWGSRAGRGGAGRRAGGGNAKELAGLEPCQEPDSTFLTPFIQTAQF